jgi:hypothetical protein
LVRGSHFYVIREVSTETGRLDRISDWMARLLRLCDGRRSVKEIIRRLRGSLIEVEESVREYVCMRLLKGALDEKFIEIYRIAPAVEDGHTGTGSGGARRDSKSARFRERYRAA